MATFASKSNSDEPVSLVGWQGVFFRLPPEWNLAAFSPDHDEGYVKVDSTGTMFAQVKWTTPGRERPKTLMAWLFRAWQWRTGKASIPKEAPDLRKTLDAFSNETRKTAKKQKASFDCRIKPETEEGGGERVAHNFSWSVAASHAQGKIWFCRSCGRVVMAQVVGQGRDNVSDVAATMLGSLTDHGADGWYTWALFDLVVGVPSDFTIRSQKLFSGQLRLEFGRRGGERLIVERWGLADVVLRKFKLEEWFRQTCQLDAHGAKPEEALLNGHRALRARGRVRNPFAAIGAVRDAILTRRPALMYDSCVWACEQTNKLYSIQLWHARQTAGLLDEVAVRCECH